MHKAPPYFDPTAMRAELTHFYYDLGGYAEARPAVVERLKLLVKDARTEAREALERDGNGRACAAGLSCFQDELIRLIDAIVISFIDQEYGLDPVQLSLSARANYAFKDEGSCDSPQVGR